MAAICYYGNHSFDPMCPKTYCSQSPTPSILHMKYEQDWSTGSRDILVLKCGQPKRKARDQAHTTISCQLSLKNWGYFKKISTF